MEKIKNCLKVFTAGEFTLDVLKTFINFLIHLFPQNEHRTFILKYVASL